MLGEDYFSMASRIGTMEGEVKISRHRDNIFIKILVMTAPPKLNENFKKYYNSRLNSGTFHTCYRV